jgi:predicted MFS family arabinose efflux permease
MRNLGRRYQQFLLATGVSALGDGLLVTGLPLLARDLSESPLVVAAVFAAGRAPWAFGLLLGAVADRTDARQLLIRTDLARGVILGLVGAWLLFADQPIPLVALLVLSVVLSTGAILFFAGAQRALPTLVEPSQLDQANGLLSTVTTAGEQFVGPPLGAVFLAGGTIPVIGDAISFVGSAAVLSKLDSLPPAPVTGTVRANARTGWDWFVRSPLVRQITFLNTVVAFLTGGVLATEVTLIRDTLKMSNLWVGVYTAVMAAGAMLGSSIAPRVIKVVGRPTFSTALLGVSLSYFACMGSRSWIVVFTGIFFQQMFTMIGVVDSVTARQRAIPPEYRGRVLSLTRSFAFGSQMFGALLGGWIAKRFGTDTLFGFAGILIFVTVLATTRRLQMLLAKHLPNSY